MRTIKEIKDEVAESHGYLSWRDYCNMGQLFGGDNDLMDEACKIYAEQALDEAMERSTILETVAYSEGRDIVCKSHKQIVNSTKGIVKTLGVDQGAFLSVKNDLK